MKNMEPAFQNNLDGLKQKHTDRETLEETTSLLSVAAICAMGHCPCDLHLRSSARVLHVGEQ